MNHQNTLIVIAILAVLPSAACSIAIENEQQAMTLFGIFTGIVGSIVFAGRPLNQKREIELIILRAFLGSLVFLVLVPIGFYCHAVYKAISLDHTLPPISEFVDIGKIMFIPGGIAGAFSAFAIGGIEKEHRKGNQPPE